MKNNFTLIVLLLVSHGSDAQELISADGSVYQNSEILLSYSIGEITTETLTGSVLLTQGFQQVDDVSTGGVDEQNPDPGFTLYPNPCKSELYLSGSISGDVHIEIYDVRGRMLLHQKFGFGNLAVLDVSDLSNGSYLLRIQSEDQGEPQTIHFQKID